MGSQVEMTKKRIEPKYQLTPKLPRALSYIHFYTFLKHASCYHDFCLLSLDESVGVARRFVDTDYRVNTQIYIISDSIHRRGIQSVITVALA